MAKETLYRNGVDGTEPLYPTTTSDQVLTPEGKLPATLALLVKIADIINDLTTGGAEKPLSAEQGKALKALIDELTLSSLPTSESGVNAQVLVNRKQERLTLLWTNETPTATFAAQTVGIDLTEYDYISILMCATYQTTTRLWDCGKMIKGKLGVMRMGGQTGDTNIYARNVTEISGSGVMFGSGYSNATVTNVCAIPVYIYGGKW